MLAALSTSGMSARAFARAQGIRESRICYWRGRLGGKGLVLGSRTAKTSKGFVLATLRERSTKAPAPVQAQPVEQTLELELSGGRRLTVKGRWDSASIGLWLSALEQAAC